jgi:hypothetical protein
VADVIATFPGKMGDIFLQWPVAKLWAKRRGEQIDVGLPLEWAMVAPLLEVQPEVDEVTFIHNIIFKTWKAMPPDYGIKDEPFMRWKKQLQMGFRDKPDCPVPLFTAKGLCIETTKEELAEQLLEVDTINKRDICVVHGANFSEHVNSVPRFWKVVPKWDIPYPVFAIGTKVELQDAHEIGWGIMPDNGDMLLAAQTIKSSKLFIGSSSSMSALAFSLGVDAVRIHDPIEGLDKCVHDPIRDNQINWEGSESCLDSFTKIAS